MVDDLEELELLLTVGEEDRVGLLLLVVVDLVLVVGVVALVLLERVVVERVSVDRVFEFDLTLELVLRVVDLTLFAGL